MMHIRLFLNVNVILSFPLYQLKFPESVQWTLRHHWDDLWWWLQDKISVDNQRQVKIKWNILSKVHHQNKKSSWLFNDFSLNFWNIQLFYDKIFTLFIVHKLIYKNNSTLNYKWCLTFTRLVLVIFPHSSRNIKTKIYFEQHLLFYITVFHHTKIFHWNHILEKNNFW